MSAIASTHRPACPIEHLTQMPSELLSVRDDLVWLCSTHSTDAAPLADTLRQLADRMRLIADGLGSQYDHGPIMRQVVHACAQAFGVTPGQILSRSRPAYLVGARHAAMRLYSIVARTSGMRTAAVFGRRDHGTAVNAFRRCRDFLDTDPDFRRRYLASATALGLSPEAALVPPPIKTRNSRPLTKP